MAYNPYTAQPSAAPSYYGYDNEDNDRTRDTFSNRVSVVNSIQQQHYPGMPVHSSSLYQPSALREDIVNKLPSEAHYGSSNAGRERDDGVTITPFDSISNVGGGASNYDSYHHRRRLSSYSASRRSGGGGNYLHEDAYNNNDAGYIDSKTYSTRPRSGSGGRGGDYEYGYDPRESMGDLPLMQNASIPAGASSSRNHNHYNNNDDADSVVDGDTVVGGDRNGKNKYTSRALNQDELERGILANNKYPPPPRYDTPQAGTKDAYDDDDEGYDKLKLDATDGSASSPKGGLLSNLKNGEERSGKRPNVFLRQFRDTTPLEDKIKNHKAGIGVQKRPWACWTIAVVLVVVFVVELVKSAQITGKAISTSPFNYMIGPSSEMLINLGARFTACMRSIPEISSTPFLCLNDTGNTANAAATQTCTLEDICGFGGFGNDGIPNQTFRFFTPLWLHVGVVHLLLNGLVLLTSSALVEKQIGTLKFLILYTISGIFGFVLGGNFALTGLASMGASGAIFGTHAAVLVDLIWHWKYFERPKRMLFALIFEIIVGFGLGYIPGIDNFSHIGGFAIGLLLSIVLVPAIPSSSRHRIAIYVARVLALIGACVMFGVLVRNFYKSDPNSACEWCRYLSCWPTDSNNRCKGTGLTMTETTTTTTTGTNDGTVGGATTSNTNVALATVSVLSIIITRRQYRSR